MGGAKSIKDSLNIQVADSFFLGTKFEHNLEALKALQFQLAHKEGNCLAYLKWDNFSKVATLGGHGKCCDPAVWFAKAVYDTQKKL